MSAREDDESDAPEEFTSLQAIQQDEEIRKVQQQSKARVRQEGKEQRKKLAERLATQSTSKIEVCDGDGDGDGVMVEDEEGADTSKQSKNNTGMLPNDIVNLLAAREKYVFNLVVCDGDGDGDGVMVEDEEGADTSKQSKNNTGMLPNDIVNLLAAREKQVFLSDSEDEKEDKISKPKKKKIKNSGYEAHCVQNSLEFLKQRKTIVARSPAVLNNSNQALRLLSSSVLLK